VGAIRRPCRSGWRVLHRQPVRGGEPLDDPLSGSPLGAAHPRLLPVVRWLRHPLPLVVPFWQAGLAQDAGARPWQTWDCVRGHRVTAAQVPRANGLPSPNGPETVNVSRRWAGKLADQAVESGHVLDTRSGTAPHCRRSQAWGPTGPSTAVSIRGLTWGGVW
jgi:hypothetical protein